MSTTLYKTIIATILTTASLSSLAAPLTLKTHLAAPEGFGVTSTIIEGEHEAILVNAQFNRSEALRVAADLLDSGKTLKSIFISYGDPDFYFGLNTLQQIFPNVEIIATPETVKHIEQTQAAKLKFWAPQMGQNAPAKTVIPKVYNAKTLKLDNENIEIKGDKELTYLWIPGAKAVVGGIPVSSGIHLWTADTAKPQDRAAVVQTLKSIQALQPEIVVPAHMTANAAQGLDAVNFSIDYLTRYEKAVTTSKNSAELIEQMKQQYPALEGTDSLELGAKVAKGEMQWQ